MVKRVALDIDGVLAEFGGHFLNEMAERGHIKPEDRFRPSDDWDDPRFRDNFHRIAEDEEFWLSIPPKFDSEELHFQPIAYITARSIPTEITETWLNKHNFPRVEVHTVGMDKSKIDALNLVMADIFVEDRYHNWKEATDAGFLTYMVNRDHNLKYKDVPKELRLDCVRDLKIE